MTEHSQWLAAALLGLGLAASCGLNTFLPLLILASTAHFHLFGVQLNGTFAWLSSDTALLALSAGTVIEVIGDKIPAVDHFLDVIGTVARPAAGALAASSVFKGDPAMAALVGLVIGAPTAFGFHAAKASARVGSSSTTLGIANPVLSFIEDFVAIVLTAISILVPWLVPVLLVLLAFTLWKMVKAIRKRLPKKVGNFSLGRKFTSTS